VGDAPAVLWEPPADGWDGQISRMRERLEARVGRVLADYPALHAASLEDLGAFWRDVAAVCGFEGELGAVDLVGSMPEARFFPEGVLNYSTEARARFCDPAEVVEVREDGIVRRLRASQFWADVDRVASWLADHAGVGRGERVAAILPNRLEAAIALHATATLGAIWTCCSPDFGPRAIVDRFAQVEPAVVFVVTRSLWQGQTIDRRAVVEEVLASLPSVRMVVVCDGEPPTLDRPTVLFEELPAGRSRAPVRVGFNDPLWILYSSGTTGIPKAIVQAHGGIVLEHKKVLELNSGISEGSRFFWFTTTGWMMWNYLLGGLLVGSSIVLYDGSPQYPDPGRLWRLIDEERLTYFGVSAPYLRACEVAGVLPEREASMASLRVVASTGAPLTAAGFRWVYDHVPASVQLVSGSGGTDVCTAFLGSSPVSPTIEGRISARALGVDAAAFDEDGAEIVGHMGELVIRQPLPSMPVAFWGDATGERLRTAYFDRYPGIWRHGDWVTFYEDGTAVIHGRSDATLNRGGVRMGTAEFYRVVESVPGVREALVVDTSSLETEGELILFVTVTDGAGEGLEDRLRAELRSQLSPRHVPNRIVRLSAIPKTLNGKKLEVPIRRLFLGEALEAVASPDAVQDYEALREAASIAAAWRAEHGIHGDH